MAAWEGRGCWYAIVGHPGGTLKVRRKGASTVGGSCGDCGCGQPAISGSVLRGERILRRAQMSGVRALSVATGFRRHGWLGVDPRQPGSRTPAKSRVGPQLRPGACPGGQAGAPWEAHPQVMLGTWTAFAGGPGCVRARGCGVVCGPEIASLPEKGLGGSGDCVLSGPDLMGSTRRSVRTQRVHSEGTTPGSRTPVPAAPTGRIGEIAEAVRCASGGSGSVGRGLQGAGVFGQGAGFSPLSRTLRLPGTGAVA
jgi:hypothetical protein